MHITRRTLCAGGVLTGLLTLVRSQAAQTEGTIALPSDADIHRLLAERVEALTGGESSVGIVVGVVGPHGRKVISYGHFNQADPRALAGDTIFEIGSVTKAFTALLLADMVQDGQVALSDPVARYLPAGVRVPQRNGRSITFVDLATHTSGLPFMPDESPATAKYSDAYLYQFLAGYKLQSNIGATWDYSNLGYWLLSQALAARSGTSYENLLATRIVAPLKLKNTVFTVPGSMQGKLAVGHDASLEPASPLSSVSAYAVMPAAGGLFSTVDDLSTVLAVVMNYQLSSLATALETTLKTRRPTSKPGAEQALGWTVIGADNEKLIFRDGGTFGYASAMAWNPTQRVGVAVLSNHVASVSDIARHLLQPDFLLEKLTITKRTEVSLAAAVLSSYVGRYEAPGEGIFEIKLEGDFLTIQAPADWGLPKLRLRPESEKDFFATELPLRVSVQSNSGRHANELLIYPPRGQHVVSAQRVNPDQ